MLIQACLNGSRRPDEHEALPLSPRAIADDAALCRAVGAAAVHVHPRGMGGHESLDPDACAAVIEAIRESSPGLPIGLTTGLWIAGGSAERLRLIERWSLLPDFCSVNVSEDGTSELCRLLRDQGIGIEAGLTSVADARTLVDSGVIQGCVRVLIEVEPGSPPGAAVRIGSVLDGAGITLPRLQHGVDREAWPVLDDALSRGYEVRIGLEDVLLMPDGSTAAGNAALVKAAGTLSAASRLSHVSRA